ncbi:MAG: hypothetical protein A2X86_10695 [Bdellovibrionales bacterium GWA2_49_15]|nr:MAG: hypothetical protein A2X86_10695 [Bdellovibrionales bacterium GWA2_49_15]
MHRLLSIAMTAGLFLMMFDADASPASFRVLTYNAENFFDHLHDADTHDYQYLPLEYKNSHPEVQAYCATQTGYYRDRCFKMDWNEATFHAKAMNIARVIKESGAETPDILILQEVENKNVLQKLVDWGLANEGYREILLVKGPDPRGINVGILSKFPLSQGMKYHQIDLSPVYPAPQKPKLTRGILEGTFNVHGVDVTIFSNHWPSQNNPHTTRVIAAQVFVKAAKAAPGYVISAGDFNTTEQDRPNGINEYLLNPNRDPMFLDFEKVHYGEQLSDEIVPQRGTYAYKGKWQSLDRFFLLKNQSQKTTLGVQPQWDSYRVVKLPFMLDSKGEPQEFDADTKQGYSDHLPVSVEFAIQ